MLKKVCLITNYNLYESKRYFTQKLAEAMERGGIETKIIDTREGVLGADTAALIKNFSPDITCSFNSLQPISKGFYLWDFLSIPHVSFLVDPVFYSPSLIDSPLSIITCVDRSDSNILLTNGFDRAFFWPHAVEREISGKNNELSTTPFNQRPYDIVFLGSCYDYESLRISWQQRNEEGINKILDDAIDLIFSNDKISLGAALATAWENSSLDPSKADFTTLYYYLDNYTRGKDRVELIRSIKDTDVHIFGELSTDNAVGILSWQQYLGSQKNVSIHPSVTFAEAIEIFKKSKVALNSMPFFRDGTHERVLIALGCGAQVVSSESLFLREQFGEDKGIIFYQSKEKEKVNQKIVEALGQEENRQKQIAAGRKLILKNHTWDQRVSELQEKLPHFLNKITV